MGPSINQAQQYIKQRRMSDSSSSSSSSKSKRAKQRGKSPEVKRRAFQPQLIQQQSLLRVQPQIPKHSPPPPKPVIQDQTGLYDENRKLRRKLKELSLRLDEQLQKAAQNKLKMNNIKNGHPVSIESQNMQLKNAYKMIQRLQKTVRDYQSKESYQVTLKRVLDLESIIKKKEGEIDQLKSQVKTQKKMLKDKDKHVQQLIDSTKKMGNPTQDKDVINKLKTKMKKIAQENDLLRKKELQKHQKLVKAERRIIDLQQQDHQMPIGKEQHLIQQIDEWKKKYKQSMQRVDRQNIYISKLNEKLTKEAHQKSRKSERISQRHSQKGGKRMVARSLEDLPSLQKKINTSQLLEHLPSPKQSVKLRRY